MKTCKIVSRKFHLENSHTLEVAKVHGAYNTLEKMEVYSSLEIIEIIKESNLRGKGGGGSPAGDKWVLMPQNSDNPSFLVVNCDESEPGTFKDRQIISKDPHLLIEGILITCFAIKAKHAYIYIRGEYKQFQDILQSAIDEAYKDGLLDNCDITIHRGAGAYICGEKSALLESMEGKRGHPRLKPKQKEPEWFFDHPALVNNVETIASVPFIIQNGANAYKAFGTKQSPGTLLFAMSGHVNKPGVYEAEYGTPMMEYIEYFGGGIKNAKKLKAVIPGGASSAILTAEEASTVTLDYETMRSMGSSLGTGGMIVMDEDTCMVSALKNLLEFYHEESCGQCTPCREGTGWTDKLVGKIVNKEGTKEDIDKLLDIADTMNGKTICVFAPAVATVITSFLSKFRDEFEAAL
ncbi:MAG: NADH-quinone oxidoreductase subunit NuoF [Sulfurovum sp.]|uniref:NADH-quinone oxidoreductase subunit NuoF n=1 Tax=Sulfurovum sp. TaxID=1969726 RepID=UPI002867C144|nr:NADH-quinone oxidoreductase subunit NuoF [Sulfurovum sp.]MCO4844703.1 NADH-quinone oxidoreductase subunit NuoF [Sulfurovum sp.]